LESRRDTTNKSLPTLSTRTRGVQQPQTRNPAQLGKAALVNAGASLGWWLN
jgi:hypothetical protein